MQVINQSACIRPEVLKYEDLESTHVNTLQTIVTCYIK